jgi:DNA-binding winged helix-turn-helix (wHTH) protein
MLAFLGVQRNRRTMIALAGLAVLVAAAAGVTVHSTLQSSAQEVKSRAMLYALAVATNLAPASLSPDGAGIDRLARYAALSGLLYVQVVSGETVLLSTAASAEAEPILGDVEGSQTPHLRLERVAGRLVVDIVLPYGRHRTDERDAPLVPAGYLRLGIDAQDFARSAVETKSFAAVAGLLAWIAACVLMVAVRRVRPAERTADESAHPAAASRTLTAGGLVLHMDDGRFCALGRSLKLTPKQRDLVALLMSEPGRPFRDDEILRRVWADSRYANSRDVKQYVYLIRRRLTTAGLPADAILANEPGLGYRIVPDAVPGAVDPEVDPPSVDGLPPEDEGCPQT